MKILFFIPSLGGGGAEQATAILMNHLCEKYETIAALTNFTIPFYPVDSRVNIIDDRIHCQLKGSSRIPRFLKMMLTIKKQKPDLIISAITKTNNNALLANLLFRKKIIVVEHNTLNRQSKHNQRIRRLLYPTANKIVFVSDEDCKAFGQPQKSLTIYNPAILPPHPDYNNRSKTIITIAPSNRWYNKGLDLLFKGWAKIANRNMNWNLEILGAIDEKIIPNDFFSYNHERIKWLGWHNNVAEILQNKSIFILASRFEGCPISLIEAMSQGCACIVTNCNGGAKEIIDDGINGLIAQTEDIDDIAEKLQMLIDDENLRRRLSSGAIEKVKQYDKNVFFAKWDKLIEEVTKK